MSGCGFKSHNGYGDNLQIKNLKKKGGGEHVCPEFWSFVKLTKQSQQSKRQPESWKNRNSRFNFAIYYPSLDKLLNMSGPQLYK